MTKEKQLYISLAGFLLFLTLYIGAKAYLNSQEIYLNPHDIEGWIVPRFSWLGYAIWSLGQALVIWFIGLFVGCLLLLKKGHLEDVKKTQKNSIANSIKNIIFSEKISQSQSVEIVAAIVFILALLAYFLTKQSFLITAMILIPFIPIYIRVLDYAVNQQSKK